MFDDHKCGARVEAAADAVAICSEARTAARARARDAAPRLAAVRIVAARNPWISIGVVAAGLAPAAAAYGVNVEYAVVLNLRRIPITLAAVVRLCEADEADGAAAAALAAADAALTAAQGMARTAAEVHELAKLTAVVQSDYAAQFETHRIATGTYAHSDSNHVCSRHPSIWTRVCIPVAAGASSPSAIISSSRLSDTSRTSR